MAVIGSTKTVKWMQGSTILHTDTLTTSSNSYDKIQYVTYSNTHASGSVDRIDFYDADDVLQRSIAVQMIEECKYDPVLVSFINKFGVLQDIWFFKTSKSSITIKKSEFGTFIATTTAGVQTYSVTDHQYKDFNITAREKFTLNTGFVDEEFNTTIKELLLSEKVWMKYDGVIVPVQPETKSLDYKKRINDNMINYTLSFQAAYNEINNIY